MNHTVTVGDCREVMAGMEADSIDAVVTSPPYAMQRAKQYGGIPESEYPDWCVAWMSEAHRLLRDSGSVLINIREHVKNGQISDYVHKTRLALRDAGWYEWEELIWVKPSSAPIGHPGRPRRAWERILWFGKSPQGYANPKANGQPSSRVGRQSKRSVQEGYQAKTTGGVAQGVSRCTDVVTCQPEHGVDHPAPYPVDLARWMIRLSTPPGGTVLDPFAGSGSTGKVAKLEGFSSHLIEMNPEYAEIARARVEGA
jgi:DNA modification methylase